MNKSLNNQFTYDKSTSRIILENLDIENKEDEYTEYIDNHISNVKKAFKKYVSKINDDFIKTHLEELEDRINHHDESKFSDEEFEAYRANYYPISDEEKSNNEANFQAAWFHHYNNNPHHYQYWLDSNCKLDYDKYDSDKVKLSYIEMLCDQLAMSMYFNNRADEWYLSNKDNMTLFPKEKEYYENLLKQVCNTIYGDCKL